MCADNTEVNRKCAKDAGVPHLPCKNHTHALDIDKLDKSDAAISKHCSEIREILTTVKASTVESGILCQVTELKPRVVKSCKWQAKFSSCDRFGRLFTELSGMSTNPDSKLSFDVSTAIVLLLDSIFIVILNAYHIIFQ
jgi:hypothetical protein